MRRKRGRSQASETLDPVSQEPPIQSQNASTDSKGFFACYLLLSLNPRFKGHTYIGFTVNPRRRIRQHNGEIGSGAWRTKRRRPWEMVLCIYGFPTNVAALQFEWAWQHPVESLAVRKAAATFKSLSGIANKIKLAYTMLTLPSWQSMNMTVNFFSTKYMQHCAGCPSLPEHMKVQICSMDELPCYTGLYGLSDNEDDSIDEEERNNITTNGDFVPDAFDGSVTHFSPQNEEPEVIEPCLPIASLKRKLSPVTTSVREEIIEDRDVTSLMNENSDELSEPDSKQSDSASAANENKEFRSSFIVPNEAEIIDLSSPSPSCRGFSGRKKRSVSCVGSTDYIDLTKSPNFIQL